MSIVIHTYLEELEKVIEGELYWDDLHLKIYATDASVYRKIPIAVAFPKNKKDLQKLIRFAVKQNIGLIPRTAGTSLAGQCVGEGMVVDVSKYWTQIIGLNVKNKTVRVQPGVIRDDLNRYLEPYGLFFGPNTSTSNRCMIGGMVGNNSSGTTSIQYGVTRDKVKAMEAMLSDGSTVTFKDITKEDLLQKAKDVSLEGNIYKTLFTKLSSPKIREEIDKNFPKPEIHRRNTGYALDSLVNTEVFTDNQTSLNLCNLLSGSEGTLAFTTEITLQLDNLPPKEAYMVAAHFHTIQECMQAVVPIMQHTLFTCEMMDKVILDCTKNNSEHLQNRFFVAGDPKAILLLEIRSDSIADLETQLVQLIKTLEENTNSYAQPVLKGDQIRSAFELRKAGLGLLGNMIGDKKAVACIEDTAVALSDLAEYIEEFSTLMIKYDQEAVYYAHAGAGEIHLRPILNLKKEEEVVLFKKITTDVAHLVKKYQGAMSGEHGDGIVRSGFIPLMLGEKNYEVMRAIKTAFDPQNIFNPGKIIDPLPMDQNLRYQPDRIEPEVHTLLNFSDSLGLLRAIEKCNGSGDCRKSIEAGGTMCPSYRATKNEKDTTRGRANVLREFLTNSEQQNKFNHTELKEAFDLCISCKGCSSECPSNVDIAAMKAEFEYQYQKENGVSLRTKLFAYNHNLNTTGRKVKGITNFVFKNSFTSNLLKKSLGIAEKRSLPELSSVSLRSWCAKNLEKLRPINPLQTVYLFIDEFTDQLDSEIGIDTIIVLTKLGYKVKITNHAESGRAFISKGLLEQAKKLAIKNVDIFSELLSEEIPLLGIEPSAILTFRDEYLRLYPDVKKATSLAKKVFLLDEFLKTEIEKGNITASQCTTAIKRIEIHGHCHQKALSTVHATFSYLNLPTNYEVTIIPSGCCGMAGSFGYEKEHYDISMEIGEQTLFPTIRKASEEINIAAPGTSCRHQIYDGTGRKALHPISIFKEALL
ncbi:FAD-binding protein [Aquimarina sp. ERC-38]|uniref:FAD-binding and (Fe-S)-binding domain-containing protein n=1 Tax=Aquimarina sp. ERC-38 TaxID=2949996 RepID=UPI0022471833|nr:FAD-binding and (Fe-S)-binding domain-containing protein [Aquimarina sp. ERC-38]UZO80192.1 FAD-binding protein [Aquimarina sp. ERC-38]